MTIETQDSPTHWAYPERLREWFSDGLSCVLINGAYEEIEIALENLNGKIMTGDEGWGVSFANPADKVIFLLKFDWSKFA